MSDPVWTAEQRRAIERRDGDLLLDAAAGSGKTSVLVERFVRGVLDDGIDVSRMLTITFTERAAAELRDRIRARLHALGAADAARATEGAFISTIHGFCGRVLRTHALAAGLDPGFAVLDRDRTEPLVAAAFDDALTEAAARDPRTVDLIAAYGAPALRAAIEAVHGQLRAAGEREPRLPPCPPPGDPGAAEALERAAAAVALELAALDRPGVRASDALDRLARCRELLARADLWPTDLDVLRLPRAGADLRTDACDAYTAALDAYRGVCAARAAGPVRDQLDLLLAAFGDRYEARKRAASGLDFEDLELLCAGLLARDGDLRERYAMRFDRIMVDELQDTNSLQLSLIESIARDNLFTVGDAQQAIYGFRHAAVELFERRGERLEAAGARETLSVNFRSRPAILAALNLAFAAELGDRFKPLVAGRDAEPGEDAPAVEFVLVDKGAEWELDGPASPWRLGEARALAARIAGLVAEGWPPGEIVVLIRATTDMRIYERALEREGLPTYVIGGRGYWSHPQVLDLVCYLRALANPRDEESFYTVLASPMVGLSLDALVLLGAAGRASHRDPWWVAREPRGALDALAADDRSRLAAFAGWFASQRALSLRAAPEELIDAALAGTGYDLSMLAMPGGRRRLANVRKLMRLAREHEQAHGPDLHGFLAVIAEREAGRTAGARESEAPVEGEGLDAIRLMTIHRAKGLEFKVVCVADLGRSVRPPADIVRVGVGAGGRLGLRLARAGAGGRESALEYTSLGAERLAAEQAEERRLFYVAMTRAQERLVLSGATRFEGWTGGGTRDGGGPVSWIARAFVPELGPILAKGGGEVVREGVRIAVSVMHPGGADAVAAPALTVAPAPPGPPVPVVPPPPDSGPPDPAPPDPAVVPPPGPGPPVPALSYSSLGAYERCGYRFYAERVLGLAPVDGDRPLAIPPRAGGPPALRSAADRGVLVHALLERLDFRRPAVPVAAAVIAAAQRGGLTLPPGPEECDELAAIVRRFAASELCGRLGRASDVRREERFAFALAGGALVVGALDVLAREPGGRLLVVDYKSDRLDGETPAAAVQRAYAVQRLIYAVAALRTGAPEVAVVHCFLERPEDAVGATYSQDRRPELERELESRAAGVLAGRFDVTQAPCREICAGCPAEGGLCSWPPEMTRREAADRLF